MNYIPCILIPVYNHGSTVGQTVNALISYQLPIILVNDGSNEQTTEVLRQLKQSLDCVILVELSQNRGKGGAVMAGFQKAGELGFTHAFQIDADGQHDLNDLEQLMALSRQHPAALISGQPIYDDSIPRHRYIARYITHFWVWVETLSLTIKDSMCGFRAYPLAACLKIINKRRLGQRMDFDIEIMVRLYWAGVEIVAMPTRVIYPEEGISHFRGLEDNVRISWMHTRLVFGMLWRSPRLLLRSNKVRHWSDEPERGAVLGMKILYHSYRLLGRRTFAVLLRGVIFYYLLASPAARATSKEYWHRLLTFSGRKDLAQPGWRQVYRHLFSFGESILDKLAVWAGDIRMEHLTLSGEEKLYETLRQGKGAVLLTSHFGNTEICRALSEKVPEIKKVNALVFNRHAVKFAKVLKSINQNADINLIHIEQMGVETSILLQEKLAQGEVIVIAADRTPVGARQRVQQVDFLGEPALFAEGPFILASVLQSPVFMMFCARHPGGFEVSFEPFAEEPIQLPRANRAEALRQLITTFSQALEQWVIRYPYQWFNFYDFWRKPESDLNEK